MGGARRRERDAGREIQAQKEREIDDRVRKTERGRDANERERTSEIERERTSEIESE